MTNQPTQPGVFLAEAEVLLRIEPGDEVTGVRPVHREIEFQLVAPGSKFVVRVAAPGEGTRPCLYVGFEDRQQARQFVRQAQARAVPLRAS